MLGALLRPQHRRDRDAGRGEHLDRAIAVEAAQRGGQRRVALLDAIEPRRVVEIAQLGERERVARAAPEVILRDHCDADEAAAGTGEHAVTGRTARRFGAPAHLDSRRRPDPRGDDVGHRDVDALPFTGLQALRPRRADEQRRDRARGEVGDRQSGDRRGVVVRMARRDRPGERLVVEVVTGALDERPGLSVARDGAIDDRRVHGRDRVVADAEAIGDARPPALAEHVDAGRQLERASAAGVGAEVDFHAALVRREIAEQRREGAHRIAARRFELAHVGAEIGEHLCRVRYRSPDARVEHAHPVEQRCRRAAHAITPSRAQHRASSVVVTVAELAQDRVGARAEPFGGRELDAAVEHDREARAEEPAGPVGRRVGMAQLLEQRAAAYRRVGRGLDRFAHAARGEADADECRFDVACGSGHRPRFDRGVELAGAGGPRPHVGEPRPQLGLFHQRAQPLELPFARARDRDPSVGAAVRVDRRATRIGIAGTDRDPGRGVVVDGLVEHQRGQHVEHRDVDELAHTREIALADRGDDSQRSKGRSRVVRDGDARPERRSVRKPGLRHRARGRLDDHVHRRSFFVAPVRSRRSRR